MHSCRICEARLNRLLSARAYRQKQHCVLTIDTAKLLKIHADKVSLSPINSGSTIYKPQPRGHSTFLSISDYPFDRWMKKRRGKNGVVELTVDYAVPDLAQFVLRVEERKGDQVVRRILG